MSISITASVVNDSTSNIERKAIKVMLQNACDYIKTFPLETHLRNTSILSILKEELLPYKKVPAYLGIGFISYENANYIQFTSTFKSFPLNKGDEFIFYFENGEKLVFNLIFNSKKDGYMFRNMSLIKDTEIELIKLSDLKFWKITNNVKTISMIGGFTYHENNNQYGSERTGKKILKLMAKTILTAKSKFEKKMTL
ncbi:MAG: hypothetical protein JSS96_08535 [Bacteroidetes bacterium]|nr:hypothetical protein [Bacteroidota bacterium]